MSCLALVSCRVRVFPVSGTRLGDRYCVRPGWAWHGHGRAGQGSLAGPEGSPKDCDTWHGERAGWLLKPNNKALAQAQARPKPSSGLFGDGTGTRGDERVPRSLAHFGHNRG